MSYTVLARKYRSQRFDDVIGQDPIAQTLKSAIRTDRVAHAYLFAGTRGVGKTTMARVLAKSLNCLSAGAPTAEPCCKCDSCVAINVGEDIDVIEIDGATNNGVEQVRELRQNAIYRPARSRFKIYIIDEVHMLTVGAFNALLKILEEPPSHVKFIFATTEPNKVIATIQSRCQRFDFNNIGPAQIAGQLKFILEQEKIKYEEDLVLPLVKMANGSMRDGLSLLDRLISVGVEPLSVSLFEQFLGCPNSEKIRNLVCQIGASDAAGTLAAIEDLISTGISEVQIADSLVDYMRDLMVIKSTGAESELLILTAEQRKRAGELAEKFDVAALIYNITTLERLRWALKNSDTPRALLEASLLRFALSEHFLNVDDLLRRLQTGSGAVKKKEPMSAANRVSRETQGDKGTKAQSHKGTEAQSDKGTEEQRHRGTEAQSDKGTEEQRHKGTEAQNNEQQTTSDEQRGKFETAADGQKRAEPAPPQPETDIRHPPKAETPDRRTSGRKRNEMISDPAVKTILMGLDATITGIEENQQN
jgi:DNA polymerase-3 subunit gamma/tau